MKALVTLAILLSLVRPADSAGAEAVPQATSVHSAPAERLEFVQRALGGWARVDRWLIEYESTFERLPESGAKSPAHVHAMTRYPERSGVRRIFAAAAPGELYEMTAHLLPTREWRSDPLRTENYVSNGKASFLRPFNRIYSEFDISKDNYLPNWVGMDILLNVMPSWPVVKPGMPPGLNRVSLIAGQAYVSTNYALRMEPETVSGEDCAVFENSSVDRIWAAKNKGLAVMKREYRDPVFGILQRTLCDELTTFGHPDLWLPKSFRMVTVSLVGTNEVIEREVRVRLLRCEVGDQVPPSTFKPTYGPGYLTQKTTGEYFQSVAGGEDLLVEIANFSRQFRQGGGGPGTMAPGLLWAGIGLMGGIGLGILLPSSRR